MKRVGLVLLYVLLCVGLVIPMGNPGSPVSANGGAAVGVSPATQTVALGGTFSVDVVVDPGSYGISGGQVDVQFDPTAMSADSLVEGGLLGASPLVGSKLIDNGAGTLQLALGRVGATTTPTAAGVFATISFTGKDKPGTFAIDITFAGMADGSFEDIALEVTDGSVRFPGGTIEVTSSPVGGSYTISEAGGAAGYGGTAPSTYNDAPPGDYSIVWGDVAGFVTPAPEGPQTLAAGGTITFEGVYAPATGTIEVNSSPVNGSFTIGGPAGYSATAPQTYNNAPVGDYTIVWGDVAGYTKPAGETKTLAEDGTITFDGVYTEIPPEVGTIRVGSAPVNGPYSITGPANYSGTANATTTSIATDAPVGDYTIVWGDVAGYTKPVDQTYTLTNGGTITFIGPYTEVPPEAGTVQVASAPVSGPYTITGPASYSGTADATTTSIATNAPVGDYTIVWGDVAGYTKPADETRTLTDGGTIAFIGMYTKIVPTTGTIDVTSNPVDGSFEITGPTTYTGTTVAGVWEVADAPAGSYTIVWADVTGYIKPADVTLILAAGSNITFGGLYTEITPEAGTIEVNSTPGGATFSITGPALYTGTAADTPTAIATDAPVGDYTIVWWDMTGYAKPADETLTLAAGGEITFSGVYIELPPQKGTIIVTSNVDAPFVLSGVATYTGTADWTKPDAHAGEYSIIWLHVDGYTTPTSGLPQTLTAGGTITFDGVYEELPGPVGTVEVTSNVGAPYTVTGPATYTGTVTGPTTIHR